MLRLMLLRHAKSSWDDGSLADFDRPLNERGRNAARAMGDFMVANELGPARVLCSAAQRARETFSLILPRLSGDLDVRLTRRLYGSDAASYLEAIREFGATGVSVMLVGHNPAIAELAQVLAPVGDAPGLAGMRTKYPTAGLAVIGFDAPRWAEIGPGTGRLIAFHTPRSIAAAP